MPRRSHPKPRKFSVVILLVLFILVSSTVVLMMDIKPSQTLIEENLDATAFLSQAQ